ncbi:5-oxoprolinase subunit PxpA [Rheinheimera sp.]|uniref:5-oxoprolinase subunit PxpA n=1 Tax=Rheinheimera sp. TaxID=1869214 RepID=UPI0027B95832|nr:5-oxoprolinase subunit PxpA [Rheinheimera sp.]
MHIDLNADIGEGFDDNAIIPWISSANISCGAHAGTESQIRAAIRSCKKAGVAIGAHPSYPDKINFGRQVITLSADELANSLTVQLKYFLQLCREEKAIVSHIKPHGALYNQAAKDPITARVLLEVLHRLCPNLALMTLPGSVLAKMAGSEGIRVITEAFADRGYQIDGSLIARHNSGALLDNNAAIAQSLRICQKQPLQLAAGTLLLDAKSLCLHGDSPHAVALAAALYQALTGAGINIQPASGDRPSADNDSGDNNAD